MEECTCQICDKKFRLTEEEMKEMHNDLKFYPSNHYSICSHECQERAIMFNACWKLKNKLKNISAMSYGTFNEFMEFPEDGGYAEDKYNKMRQNPTMFMMMLDQKNFLKFIEVKI